MAKHYHLIGIGGIGMSGIAQLLLGCGKTVSGSDLKESKITRDLIRQGAQVFVGHAAAYIEGADVVVYSSAIKDDNPELMQAKKKGLPLVKRAEVLAELMQDKTVITVTGSHGKTTTTSLISFLLMQAGFSPTAAIGGVLRNINTNACLGKGDFFVAEADESDGTFLCYHPRYSVITNIDREHLDYYKDFANVLAAYEKFLQNTRSDGCVFCCADDPHLRELLKKYPQKSMLYGLKEDADIYPKNIEIQGLSSQFDCFLRNEFIGHFSLSLGGMHNISNSLAVIALGLELGIDLALIKKALKEYQGAKRRLEVKLQDGRYQVVDDYAHHPTEIMATLGAARNLKFKRLIAVFQPHRYTRTQFLLDEFARSFDFADYLLVTDIYPAGEKPIEGINANLLCERIKKNTPGKEIHYLPKGQLVAHLVRVSRPGDLILTLGAGDINKISDELAEELKRKN